MLRPGDPAYFDILHAYMGYRTCYYRTFAIGSASPALVDAYKRCRDYLDAAINMIKPGVTTGEVVELWRQLWLHPAPELTTFKGKFVQVHDLPFSPAPHHARHRFCRRRRIETSGVARH